MTHSCQVQKECSLREHIFDNTSLNKFPKSKNLGEYDIKRGKFYSSEPLIKLHDTEGPGGSVG